MCRVVVLGVTTILEHYPQSSKLAKILQHGPNWPKIQEHRPEGQHSATRPRIDQNPGKRPQIGPDTSMCPTLAGQHFLGQIFLVKHCLATVHLAKFRLAKVQSLRKTPLRWTFSDGLPKISRCFSLSRHNFHYFFLSWGLFVELWPRFKAEFHTQCAFGLPKVISETMDAKILALKRKTWTTIPATFGSGALSPKKNFNDRHPPQKKSKNPH